MPGGQTGDVDDNSADMKSFAILPDPGRRSHSKRSQNPWHTAPCCPDPHPHPHPKHLLTALWSQVSKTRENSERKESQLLSETVDRNRDRDICASLIPERAYATPPSIPTSFSAFPASSLRLEPPAPSIQKAADLTATPAPCFGAEASRPSQGQMLLSLSSQAGMEAKQFS
ncbi:hypothetical protein D623_10032576 [Myotis brandtii]|uniref:Uncharacterized protein n=1 Tax=Myotis brandtii TaxID=109478 RepID=S7MVE0_MYOBR|nr:hypothetical protein D623_10032576 [Myotis brandtii]